MQVQCIIFVIISTAILWFIPYSMYIVKLFWFVVVLLSWKPCFPLKEPGAKDIDLVRSYMLEYLSDSSRNYSEPYFTVSEVKLQGFSLCISLFCWMTTDVAFHYYRGTRGFSMGGEGKKGLAEGGRECGKERGIGVSRRGERGEQEVSKEEEREITDWQGESELGEDRGIGVGRRGEEKGEEGASRGERG